MAFRFPVKNHQGPTEGGRPAATARVSVFRRLLVRVTPAERLAADGKEVVVRDKDERPQAQGAGVGGGDAEVGSVALDRMVLSFMEDSAAVERPPRGRCNCFNGQDASDDEDFDFLPSSSSSAPATNAPADALELLKGLVQCTSTAERNLLADASRIADCCGKSGVRKKSDVRRAVADGPSPCRIPFKIHVIKDHDMKERLCLEAKRLGLSAMIMGSSDFGASRKGGKGRLRSVSDYCVHPCVCPVPMGRLMSCNLYLRMSLFIIACKLDLLA